MRFTLPDSACPLFWSPSEEGKIDAAGSNSTVNANVAEIHNQVMMMLGHEIFDPEIGKRVLVDSRVHRGGGEITKAARNWLGGKLDQSKRSQIMFMDREDILNLFTVTNVPLPKDALPKPDPLGDDPPF